MKEHKKGYAKVSSFKMNNPDNQRLTAINLKGIFNYIPERDRLMSLMYRRNLMYIMECMKVV